MQSRLYLWVLTSSILLVLSFPQPDVGPACLVALVPLLEALSGQSILRSFLWGWGAGTTWFFFSYNWVSHSIVNFGDIPFPIAEGLILLLASIHGLYVGLFSVLIPLVGRESGREGASGHGDGGSIARRLPSKFPVILAPVLVLPPAWVLLEMARSWFPAPFPWLLLGSAARKLPLIGAMYELAGVYGVSFWVVAVNAAVWMVFRASRELRGWAGLTLAAIIALPVTLSPFSLSAPGDHLRVGVVQGNFRQELKWEETMVEETLETYLDLTSQAVDRGAKMVVWPETAIPSFYQAEPELMERLRGFTSRRGVHLVFGSPGYVIKGRKILLYNRVYHLPPDGVEEFYDKIMLVPFGEYVPLAGLLPFVDRMVPGEGEFARGSWKAPFTTPVPSGALICYEATIPFLARREVRDGASILINVTNDAWFGRSWGPYQHLETAAVRAMENSVPILRAANTGVSAVIDRRGRVVERIPLGERGVIVTDVAAGAGKTLYSRLGDWIVIPSAAVLLVYILILLRPGRSYKWTTSKPSKTHSPGQPKS